MKIMLNDQPIELESAMTIDNLLQQLQLVYSMATQMLENGADTLWIQAMLGHSDMSTTQIYARVSIRALKEIHTATHPAKLVRESDDRANNV